MAARTLEELKTLVKTSIKYPDFEFIVKCLDGEGWHTYIQVQSCDGKCNVTGEPITWRGRKWLISPWATEGEVVQTAFLAVMTALEHEARENFKYKGMSIFDPHYDLDALWNLRRLPEATVEREKIHGTN